MYERQGLNIVRGNLVMKVVHLPNLFSTTQQSYIISLKYCRNVLLALLFPSVMHMSRHVTVGYNYVLGLVFEEGHFFQEGKSPGNVPKMKTVFYYFDVLLLTRKFHLLY